MASTMATNFTIRSWDQNGHQEDSVIDILTRAKEGRGHFREVTEASLQEEIAAEGALELSESESDSDDDDGEDAGVGGKVAIPKPTTREDLFAARHTMLQAMGAAKNEVMMALDLMSLVASKDNPNQALSTMSPAILEMVPVGTMGIDLWKRMPVDQARETQEATLAANVKMDSLQRSADTLLDAAKRLETNVRRETQYWDQILSISDKGWNVCKIPGREHRLGVHFGFGESAPQFSQRGIAALNSNDEGTIHLDRGVGSKPQALRAVLRRGNDVIGVSKVPEILDSD